MTLKAVRTITECQAVALSVDGTRRDREAFLANDGETLRKNCVAYRIAEPVTPGIGEKQFLYLSMPMTKDSRLLEKSHREAAEAISRLLGQGLSVAWLTLGDATVYGTSMYVAEAVASAGYETEVISGVPSFCAAAARLKRPLAQGKEELHIIPSSYHIEEALEYPGIKVLMKAGSRIGDVKTILEEKGKTAQGVERCGMEGERVFHDLEEVDGEAGYYTILIAE
jgi:precorrin-2/cobalt-factor-2 C20-methyltransferase